MSKQHTLQRGDLVQCADQKDVSKLKQFTGHNTWKVETIVPDPTNENDSPGKTWEIQPDLLEPIEATSELCKPGAKIRSKNHDVEYIVATEEEYKDYWGKTPDKTEHEIIYLLEEDGRAAWCYPGNYVMTELAPKVTEQYLWKTNLINFPGRDVDIEQFQKEIEASIVKSPVSHITKSNNVVTIAFDRLIPISDNAVLDYLVSQHRGPSNKEKTEEKRVFAWEPTVGDLVFLKDGARSVFRIIQIHETYVTLRCISSKKEHIWINGLDYNVPKISVFPILASDKLAISGTTVRSLETGRTSTFNQFTAWQSQDHWGPNYVLRDLAPKEKPIEQQHKFRVNDYVKTSNDDYGLIIRSQWDHVQVEWDNDAKTNVFLNEMHHINHITATHGDIGSYVRRKPTNDTTYIHKEGIIGSVNNYKTLFSFAGEENYIWNFNNYILCEPPGETELTYDEHTGFLTTNNKEEIMNETKSGIAVTTEMATRAIGNGLAAGTVSEGTRIMVKKLAEKMGNPELLDNPYAEKTAAIAMAVLCHYVASNYGQQFSGSDKIAHLSEKIIELNSAELVGPALETMMGMFAELMPLAESLLEKDAETAVVPNLQPVQKTL